MVLNKNQFRKARNSEYAWQDWLYKFKGTRIFLKSGNMKRNVMLYVVASGQMI